MNLFDTSGSPPSSLSSSSRGAPSARPTSVRFDSDPIAGPSSSKIVQDVYELLTPADPDDKYANHHGFITQAHRPRVFKKWVGELSDMCRDYFWCVPAIALGLSSYHRVMCHGSNTLWPLDEVDPNLVERPVAPGGATGGVEYEAMNYVVRLVTCNITHVQALTHIRRATSSCLIGYARPWPRRILMPPHSCTTTSSAPAWTAYSLYVPRRLPTRLMLTHCRPYARHQRRTTLWCI